MLFIGLPKNLENLKFENLGKKNIKFKKFCKKPGNKNKNHEKKLEKYGIYT